MPLLQKLFLLCLLLILVSGCASRFPRPLDQSVSSDPSDALSAQQIFAASLQAHGGDQLSKLRNVNVGISGEWKRLITRIQPLVTDHTFRVDSQERLVLDRQIYAANYQGPGGSKSVFRAGDETKVFYNQESSTESEVISSTALTADAFYLFLLGPLALSSWQSDFIRLRDAKLNGKRHYRLYLKRQPGFGFAENDEVVLWINPETRLSKMIQITLTGHESTRRAHVEVEYLDYVEHRSFVFPAKFFERVNAPISIDAHAWELVGLDINRDYTITDLSGDSFKGKARQPAAEIQSTELLSMDDER